MSKKSFLLSLLTTMVVAMLSVGFSSCGGDDDDNNNPNNGQPVNPSVTVNDPEGTISLSMRNADNGKTYLDNIYIKNENFVGASFVSVGAVKGLGNVSTIPTAGWADQVSVIAGNGYVAYSNDQFYRIYVVGDIVAATGGIIGADIKYQKPFKGVDEAISLDERSLTFGNKGGSQLLVFNNKNIVLFSASTDQSWCRVQKSSTYDKYFLYNAINISVDPSTSLTEETANVTLKTIYGKEIVIKVTRAGAEPVLNVETNTTDINADAQSFRIGVNSNYDINDIQVNNSNDWISAKIVDGTNSIRAKAAQVKYIGENQTTRAGSNNNSANSYYLEVTTKSNYNTSARQGTITLKGKDRKVSTTITINQQNAELFIENNTISLTAREISSNTQSFRTNIQAENLQISSDASWCNVWLKEGDNKKFYYSLTANTSGNERQAKITIKPKEGNLAVIVSIIQAEATIYMSKEKLWFDRNNGNQTITVTDDLDNWEVESSSASWCTFTKNGNNLTIRVNATNTDREATIKFVGYNKKVMVVQSKYTTGDSYNENGVTGTVGTMKDGVRYIYKEVGSTVWSMEMVVTGATNLTDGESNMAIIKKISNWKNLYPAFELCEALNSGGVSGWYLPASDETFMPNINNVPSFWTSTERGEKQSYFNGAAYSLPKCLNKDRSIKVFAVRKF